MIIYGINKNSLFSIMRITFRLIQRDLLKFYCQYKFTITVNTVYFNMGYNKALDKT